MARSGEIFFAMNDAQQREATDAAYTHALRAELERRIAELGSYPDDAFGRLGRGDAWLVIGLFLVLPALAAWIYR
jgi:hypothetical protein